MKIAEPLVYSKPEQHAIIMEALGIFPNVWVVYNYVGKRIGVSYGSIWNIAKAQSIKLIRFDRRKLPKQEAVKCKTTRKNQKSRTGEKAPAVRRKTDRHAPATRPQRG